MKNSIARKVTKRVSFILAVALTILFIGSFFLVSYIIYTRNQKLSRTIVSLYSDLIVYESEKANTPIDSAHTKFAYFYGDYICKWYGIDYVYIAVPNENNNTLNYITFSSKKNKNLIQSHTVDYVLSKEEKNVLNGKEVYAEIKQKNDLGYQYITMMKIKDSFGNEMLAGVSTDYKTIKNQVLSIFCLAAIIIVLVILSVDISVYMIIKKLVSKPAQLISKRMNEFIINGKHSEEKLNIKGYNEYSMIANAFNSMTDDIGKYIKNINSLTREQERQNTELYIASQIQKGFLPKELMNTNQYAISAMMYPAKNVGGDLYDYVKLDDNRVLTVIADVSGKGISAAIFMAVTLMLIRQFAKMNLSPEEILFKTNDILSENNSSLIFATAFIGIYDSKKHILNYSNAGHNLPYIIGKETRILNGASGAPLGLYPDEKYSSNTASLSIGDTLFLYTDGVNESVNKNKEFYSLERLEQSFETFKASNKDNLISFVNDNITKFSEDAEQYDDITMLTLKVKETKELMLEADVNELTKIKELILSLSLERTVKLNLCLVSEECFVNICSYAFENRSKEKVYFSISISDRAEICFIDSGIPFNPFENIINADEYDIDTKTGGLGDFIVASNMDDIEYKYENSKNIIKLTKYFKEEEQ